MENKNNIANNMLTLSLIGIAAILITIISDIILLGSPISARLFIEMRTECMADIAQWRITAGVFAGVIALPFQVAGLVSVYHGLKPSGRVLPLFVVISGAHALIMGVAFHMSYAFIADGWKLYHVTGAGNESISAIVRRFDFYWKVIVITMLIELLAVSIVFAGLVMKGKTLYPRWMALFNPLCILLAVFLIMLMIPAPVGGYIAPVYLNISTLIFVCISTVVIHRRLKKKDKEVGLFQ